MADLPSTVGKNRGDLVLFEGLWHILHSPIGSGLRPQWVFDQNVHNVLQQNGVRRVSGSGDNMKLYGGAEDGSRPIYDLSKQADMDAFSNLYRGVVDDRDVATSSYQQGAPVDLKKMWEDIYGSSIEFPEIFAVDEFGRPVYQKDADGQETDKLVTDVSKYNEVIAALESRVGSLSKY